MAVSKIQSKGEYYSAAWTSTATSANMARLTDSLTLPKGVYIIVGKVPIVTGNFPGFSVKEADFEQSEYHNQNLVFVY